MNAGVGARAALRLIVELRSIVARLIEQQTGVALCDACLAFAATAPLTETRTVVETSGPASRMTLLLLALTLSQPPAWWFRRPQLRHHCTIALQPGDVGHGLRNHRRLATIRFFRRCRLGSLNVAVKALKRPTK